MSGGWTNWPSYFCRSFRDATDFVARGIAFVEPEGATGGISAGVWRLAICDEGIKNGSGHGGATSASWLGAGVPCSTYLGMPDAAASL
ncbi:hypothetical protein LSCM1_03503 [Leishmania martiniquensis]|uniref:Uncharacterized protein n=1 Tax=Leishmania martiniquensis TaxID=1580590 RepID=A0A836HEI4_9TRYP|nr:hypothetical protein LSCM1_03503 [Leishmania martiniquensis]